LDFDPKKLPIAPIRVALDPPDPARFLWRIELVVRKTVAEDKTWMPGEKFALLYGKVAEAYNIQLYGFPKEPTKYQDCRSELTDIGVVTARMATIHVAIPANCR
jgi:hypothetical protein